MFLLSDFTSNKERNVFLLFLLYELNYHSQLLSIESVVQYMI